MRDASVSGGAARMIATIGPACAQTDAPQTDAAKIANAATAAARHSDYLSDLMARDGAIVAQLQAHGLPHVLAAARTDMLHAHEGNDVEPAMRQMRLAKKRTHLALALYDLAGLADLETVTRALSDLADAALSSALTMAAKTLQAREELRAVESGAAGPIPGLILIAMGKHGAGELNYSSDIDFSIFYDAAVLPLGPRGDARATSVRIGQLLVRMLEEITVDGYVFRTDLRLRPDPGSTPIAVSLAAAEHYYQTLGQNWERAAFIKARACAGDVPAGEAFLQDLQSFIWRRHLDFAAIADVHSIKRQILAAHKGADLNDTAFDVKLGRGGIRDIELFAQTQQLILGGRNRALRARATRDALKALREADALDPATEHTLQQAYVTLRMVEHRIQMLRDAHTHKIPADSAAREHLAQLCGMDTFAALHEALVGVRHAIARIDARLFRGADTLADEVGSLVFTGVEDDAETLITLKAMGYQKPQTVSATVRGWHHGRIRATRSARARELLTALMPRLLRAIAGLGEPDATFARFDEFLSGLPAGIQVFALLDARPELLRDLSLALGLAPALAQAISRRPALLDVMVEQRFALPLRDDPAEQRATTLDAMLREATSFEAKINAARRFHREEAFRIGMQVLSGLASAADAGRAHADLADACVAAMARASHEETERAFGPAPGRFVVLALGSFGAREMAANSDLDIMVVFDATDVATGASEFFTRFTQRLIAALTAPTEEGMLYAVDMQLRPSGSKGPVAVSLSSFRHYYASDAWTWELQALTRARIAAGDATLAREVMTIVAETLDRPRPAQRMLDDVADMRARLERERPAKGAWDLKRAPGGLIDLEFIVQALTLRHPGVVRGPGTLAAIESLVAHDRLTPGDGAMLRAAFVLYADLQQAMRVCLPDTGAPEGAAPATRTLLARVAHVEDFAALEHVLARTQREVRALFLRLVGPISS